MKFLCVIPARGGSKGIPRKNIRFMAGKPLIFYAIDCAKSSSYKVDVVISTDDDEIKNICELHRDVSVIPRPEELANDKATLDPVIFHAVNFWEEKNKMKYDAVITMQPTSPLLTVETLNEGIKFFIENDIDTVISGVNNPRLSWKVENGKFVPNYEKRLNRQYMPKDIKETGAFVITKREFVTENSRFGKKVCVFEIPENEAIDIDTADDWCLCELGLNRKKIIIRCEGYPEIGMGHIYRGLLLASNFIEHDVVFVLSEKSVQGISKIEASHYQYKTIKTDEDFFKFVKEFNADIIINDILNTSKSYMQELKGLEKRIVNFEDLGDGRKFADAVVNALYEKSDNLENTYWGEDYYLMRDEFRLAEPKKFSEAVDEIVVSFGGTDPANITQKTVMALKQILAAKDFHATIILGLGYSKDAEIRAELKGFEDKFTVVKDVKMMTEYLKNADIAIASQGRTSLELASMGIPTILLAQNERETTHKFGTMKNGFLNLGLGKDIEVSTLTRTIEWLIGTPQIRKNMREEMLSKDLRNGIKRVKGIILGE